MSISGPPPFQSGNRLLDLLPKNDYRRLFPHLEMVPLKFKQILYEPRSVIDHVYFPREGAASPGSDPSKLARPNTIASVTDALNYTTQTDYDAAAPILSS